MQTLRYRLTRRPSNLDDHLALVAGRSGSAAEVVCVDHAVLHEMKPFRQWVVRVRFALPDGVSTCEVVCGACGLGAPRPVRLARRDRVQRRLEALLGQLAQAGVAVEGRPTFRLEPATGRMRFPLWEPSAASTHREDMD